MSVWIGVALGLAIGIPVVDFFDRRARKQRVAEWNKFIAALPGQTNPNYGLNGDWRETLPKEVK